MKVTVLGCGTSTGVPMVGCRCAVCTSEDRRDRRTRSSILVEEAGKYIIVDTSPDLRRQALREKVPHIDAVLFTHSHADHINGIDDLRGFHFIHRRLIPCFAAKEAMDVIMANFAYIFKGRELPGYAPLLEPHQVDAPFDLFGLTIMPVPLTHGEFSATGFRLGTMAYLTDCSAIPDASRELLKDLDLLIIDALRYTPHSNHFNIEGALGVVEELKPGRAIFTHLSHEVAYADTARLPAGVELAYDGMVIELAD
ncbi:MAG: MBL fold metallo-hydrolase [Geobacter sp.]|nr:MBL fold metallo-hydrolase [Geobacter sp.]